MKRKNIIIISVFINTGLLVILLIGALTTKEEFLSSSSSKVAQTILEKDEKGMKISKNNVLTENENLEEVKNIFQKLEEKEILYKLPEIELKKNEDSNLFKIAVQKGDSLEKIAKINNTTVEEIIKINNLSNAFLKIGQVLLVPKINLEKEISLAKKEKTENEKIEVKEYYIVKAGDNPWTIAMRHHMKVKELLNMNGLDEAKARRLRPGDKLRIR